MWAILLEPKNCLLVKSLFLQTSLAAVLLMLFGNPQLYADVRDAKLGKVDLPAPLERLRRLISEHFSINVLYIVYDYIDIGPAANRPRLNLIVETATNAAAVYHDRFTLKQEVRETTARYFTEIAAESPQTYDADNAHIVFDVFSEEAMGQAASRFREHHGEEIIAKFPDANIWAIEGVSKYTVVFYQSDIDVSINSRGVSGEIEDCCYRLTKSYDEFEYFTRHDFPVSFDSKECLDSDYEGNLYYYFK